MLHCDWNKNTRLPTSVPLMKVRSPLFLRHAAGRLEQGVSTLEHKTAAEEGAHISELAVHVFSPIA